MSSGLKQNDEELAKRRNKIISTIASMLVAHHDIVLQYHSHSTVAYSCHNSLAYILQLDGMDKWHCHMDYHHTGPLEYQVDTLEKTKTQLQYVKNMTWF